MDEQKQGYKPPPPPENQSTPEETKTPIDFTSLDLWELSQTSKKTKEPDPEDETARFENSKIVNIKGYDFTIVFTLETIDFNESINFDTISISINKDDKKMIVAELEIEKVGEQYKSFVYIEGNNNDTNGGDTNKQQNELKGQARILYEKVLDFLQHYADANGHQLCDIVKNISSLTEERWQEIFAPILKPKGYEALNGQGNERYKKIYYPSPKK
ncbi:MAG TPA: hypothetical protein DEB09_01690 [Candidatus Magasanikbacteria bacterium]|nr:hypothetical protein [Candidatus Magasanikbacteria bacterium]